MAKEAVWPNDGPEPKGPYSPAIVFKDLVFVSGQGPVDPATGELVGGDVLDQMKAAMKNVEIILKAAGCSFGDVLKVTVYLADMNDFSRMNELYATYFGPTFPARTTIQAGRLPMDIKIEIDVTAAKR
jgi:2-iminobutanoate/2-iminopropanoate deaminase